MCVRYSDAVGFARKIRVPSTNGLSNSESMILSKAKSVGDTEDNAR